MGSHMQQLETFGLGNLPTLDIAVLGALELFSEAGVPKLPQLPEGQILIVGSVNAAATGRIVGANRNALYADESDYKEALGGTQTVQAALLISASGAKHAVEIAKYMKERGVRTILLTHNESAPAKEFISPTDIVVFPKNREPYTYNTSTYLGVILANTQEDPRAIQSFIDNQLAPQIPDNFASFDAFFITVPSRFRHAVPMLYAKFDELLAPKVSGRIFTTEHAKHATTVIPSDTEYFISIGEDKLTFGPPERQLVIPLPPNAGYGFLLSVAYHIVGMIQKQHPPYFKEYIVTYCERASKLFGQKIEPIVE